MSMLAIVLGLECVRSPRRNSDTKVQRALQAQVGSKTTTNKFTSLVSTSNPRFRCVSLWIFSRRNMSGAVSRGQQTDAVGQCLPLVSAIHRQSVSKGAWSRWRPPPPRTQGCQSQFQGAGRNGRDGLKTDDDVQVWRRRTVAT